MTSLTFPAFTQWAVMIEEGIEPAPWTKVEGTGTSNGGTCGWCGNYITRSRFEKHLGVSRCSRLGWIRRTVAADERELRAAGFSPCFGYVQLLRKCKVEIRWGRSGGHLKKDGGVHFKKIPHAPRWAAAMVFLMRIPVPVHRDAVVRSERFPAEQMGRRKEAVLKVLRQMCASEAYRAKVVAALMLAGDGFALIDVLHAFADDTA